MRNLVIIIFIFFLLFLISSLFIADPQIIFLMLTPALLIAFICLSSYLGIWRGILITLLLIFLPFLIEYIFFLLNLPFLGSPMIQKLTLKEINLPITVDNLFSVFATPLIFISALIFSQKMKIFVDIKKYHKTFIIIISSLLIAINFLLITQTTIGYENFIKWLIIALITISLISPFLKFRAKTPGIYKDLPIVLYLAIYGVGALRLLNIFNLIIAVLLISFYLYILYKEYKIRKISEQQA